MRMAAIALGLLMGIALAWSGALAQTGSLVHDPSELVTKYLTLDVKGVRLDAISREALAPYTVWKKEPLWGYVVVVTSYEVINDFKQWTVVSLTEVVIPVEYKVIGSLDWETASFYPDKRVERVGFRVKVVGDRWRIAEPKAAPHVGQKRMINYVRQAILDETDQRKLGALDTLLKELGKGN